MKQKADSMYVYHHMELLTNRNILYQEQLLIQICLNMYQLMLFKLFKQSQVLQIQNLFYIIWIQFSSHI